jgi:hypothetical protein
MLRNGRYTAWFRTPLGEGMGIVALTDGKIEGGDTVLSYAGTYFQNGDQFSANVTTWRHTPGKASVFEIDNVDLTLTGTSAPMTASCTGTARQAPDLAFEATLVRMAD